MFIYLFIYPLYCGGPAADAADPERLDLYMFSRSFHIVHSYTVFFRSFSSIFRVLNAFCSVLVTFSSFFLLEFFKLRIILNVCSARGSDLLFVSFCFSKRGCGTRIARNRHDVRRVGFIRRPRPSVVNTTIRNKTKKKMKNERYDCKM